MTDGLIYLYALKLHIGHAYKYCTIVIRIPILDYTYDLHKAMKYLLSPYRQICFVHGTYLKLLRTCESDTVFRNIDNGYGAAYSAVQINRLAEE